MSQRLLLRDFDPSDDDELISWFPDAAALRRFAGPTLDWPLTQSQLHALRANPTVHAWTGWTTRAAPRRVAHAELVRVDDGCLLLARVAVAPADRGRGLGTALLHEVVQKARSLKVRRLELNVYSDNDSAVRLYRSMGFEDQGTIAEQDDVIRMARSLY